MIFDKFSKKNIFFFCTFCLIAIVILFNIKSINFFKKKYMNNLCNHKILSINAFYFSDSLNKKSKKLNHEIFIKPLNETFNVNPNFHPEISVNNGYIIEVNLISKSFNFKKNNIQDKHWIFENSLLFNETYDLSCKIIDKCGNKYEYSNKFHTINQNNESYVMFYPKKDNILGVGQPIEIRFNKPVLNKKNIQKQISILSTKNQIGEFHWYSDYLVRYRPKYFWIPNQRISIKTNLLDVDIGNNVYCSHNVDFSFYISSSRIAIIDNIEKNMKIYENNFLIKDIPVTLGSKRWPSTGGYHVLLEKQRYVKFDPKSIGLQEDDKDYYHPITVEFAMRFSLSGEFLHQAIEQALPYIGIKNVSHGCIGLLPKDAEWMFEKFDIGDVIKIINTDGKILSPLDGFGDWNIEWNDWNKDY